MHLNDRPDQERANEITEIQYVQAKAFLESKNLTFDSSVERHHAIVAVMQVMATNFAGIKAT